MLSCDDLDGFARRYYLASDIADHRIENRIQEDGAGRVLSLLPEGGRVLELGTGDGILTAALQRAGVRAELLEGSPLLCARAAGAHPGLVVHQGLFEGFAPGAVYDAVLALHVLEHVNEPGGLLRQIAGWLRPGGVVVAVVPNRASIHRRVALRMGLIGALDELSARDHLVGHRRVYDLAGLEGDLVAAGLRPRVRFGSFLKALPNSMMLDQPDALLTALEGISDELPPELLANIGVVAGKWGAG